MKITEIQFTNYKVFYGENNFNKLIIPNGSNLLIYGENGSGKSSIYEGMKNLFFASNNVSSNAHFPISAQLKNNRSVTRHCLWLRRNLLQLAAAFSGV